MFYSPEDVTSLVTTAEAATLAGVSVSTIRTWANRNLLEKKGLDEFGRPMYRWIDVARAERATRERARRKFAA